MAILSNRKAKIKDEGYNIEIIPFTELDPHTQQDMISIMNSKVREAFLLYGNTMFMRYFDEKDFTKSPIFDKKTAKKRFLVEFFSDVLELTTFTVEDYAGLFKGLSQGGVTLDLSIGNLSDKPVGFLVLLKKRACEMLASLFVEPVDISTVYSKRLVKHCEQKPTLGNILYLNLYDKED